MNRSMLVISPHLGDGVRALGYALAISPGSTVATVCTGSPPADPTAQRSMSAAVEGLDRELSSALAEDAEALALLNCKHLHLDFFDERYELPRTPRLLRSVLADTITSLPSCQPVGPFGLGSPDHQLVADCVLDAADQLGLARLWMYEDDLCRSAAEAPENGASRRTAIERRGWHLSALQLEENGCDTAISSKRAYRSRQWLPTHEKANADARVWVLKR
ncbi:MAG: glcNAc-PI de-N-acetylase family protein [Acidimicrobiales bacterium]|nr:glcNAc-PI de-N-acetylase family protein [Acidimicrobiales bacterium]